MLNSVQFRQVAFKGAADEVVKGYNKSFKEQGFGRVKFVVSDFSNYRNVPKEEAIQVYMQDKEDRQIILKDKEGKCAHATPEIGNGSSLDEAFKDLHEKSKGRKIWMLVGEDLGDGRSITYDPINQKGVKADMVIPNLDIHG
jgi:hypothetical protein